MSDNVNSAFFSMPCDSNTMPTEWQMIPGFSQAQMDGLKDLFDRTISSAIEVAFAQQTSQMIEMLQALNDNVTALASVIPNAPTSSAERWDSVIHEQEQPAIEPTPVLEQTSPQLGQNDSAKHTPPPAAVSPTSPKTCRPVFSPPRWLRSALKRAPIALLAAYDALLPPHCAWPVASFWCAVRPLYHGLVKKGLG